MNKADKQRIDSFRHIGCCVTRFHFGYYAEYDVHHLVEGNKRLGHRFTIPLSPWFHRGVPPNWLTQREAYLELGPSLELHKREFVERFGSERDLLARVDAALAVKLAKAS